MRSRQKNYTITIIISGLLICAFCVIAGAELVSHEGLPNKEGVKVAPLGSKLGSYDLPNRDGIKIDAIPLTVHTAFKTQVEFDTNIFLENSSEDFDVITILTPSAGLELKLGDNDLSIDYETKINLYAKYNDHSYVDQRLRGLIEINLTDFKISLADVYRYFSDRTGSEDVNHVQRQNNYLRSGISAQFEQLGFDVGYTLGLEDYRSDDTIFASGGTVIRYKDKDRVLNVFDAEISYKFLPKTSFLLEAYAGFSDYPSSLGVDSFFTETMVGLLGELQEDFSTNIKAGFRYQDYADSTLLDSDNYIGPVVSGGFTYKATEDDIINVILERNIFESTFNELNYYNVNHAGADYTHFFNDKLSGSLFGWYQLNLYPSSSTVGGVTEKRYDQIFGGGTKFRYDMQKWAAFEVSYEYKQRKSIFETFDYTDNLVTISATVGF